MSETLLFVYGTLRAGGRAGSLLQGCRRLGEGTVAGVLYDVGGRYPALVAGGEARVHGEIWSCGADLLPALDAYEGVDGGLFRRVRVAAGGRECWAYVAGPALEAELRPERRIPGGRWPPTGEGSA